MHFAIDISGMERDEIDSFVIVAPSGARSEADLRDVEIYLKSRFPDLEFFASGEEPFEGDYLVVPMRGIAGEGEDALRMLDPPDPVLVLGIQAALKAFRPGQPPAIN